MRENRSFGGMLAAPGLRPLVLAGCSLLVLTAVREATAQPAHVLFETIRRRDVDTVRSLLRQGTPVEVRDARGSTPLMLAALHGNAESVRLLLERGARPNATNDTGVSALLWGAGDAEKVRWLLHHGANPNARSRLGNTPLMAAAGHPDSTLAVKLLLREGADVNAENKRGRTALTNAVVAGNLETVRLLIARGADVSAHERRSGGRRVSLVASAAQQGDRELVEVLLESGASADVADTFAGHALNYALLGQQPAVAKLLIDKGVDVRLRAPVGKVPPLVLAAYTEVDDASVADLLIARGVDVNAANEHDETVLTWARTRGHRTLIERLLEAGATESEAGKTKPVPSKSLDFSTVPRTEWIKASVGRSIGLLQRSSDAFLRTREGCVSCHHQNLPAVAIGWARDRGFRVDDDSLRREIAAQIRSWSPSVERAYQMDRPVPVPPRFLGYGLLGFAALGYPPDEVTEAMVWYLAAIQRRDGHWEPGFRRPPLGGGEILSTTLALRALQLYPVVGRSREFSERIGRARSWLRRSRPRTHQERVFQVLGLSWAGSPREELAPRIETLLEEQRDDGGWAQLPGLRSDAWATGQSLVALRVGGGVPADHPAYRRGVDFLLRTQFEDGSWYVKSRAWPFQPRFDSKFPHGRDQWVSAPATAWAVMGLTLAVEPFAAVTVFDASPAVASPKPTAGKPTAGKPSAAASEAPAARSSTAAVRVDFAREIQPLLERSCVGCHAGKKPKGNFRVTGRASLIQGGESGEPAIVPGRPGESPLIRFVSGRVEDMEMPPLKARRDYPALTKREIDRLRAWIQGGAPWPDGVELGVPVKRRRL